MADDVGRRLENFFWRIWGNKTIRDKITGIQVAALYSHISEGGFLRTTPTQSPRTSRSLGSYESRGHLESRTASPPTMAPTTLAQSHGLPKEEQEKAVVEFEATNRVDQFLPGSKPLSREHTQEAAIPPSILKKPKMVTSSQVAKRARVASKDAEPGRRETAASHDRQAQFSGEQASLAGAVRGKGSFSSGGHESPFLEGAKRRSTDGAAKSSLKAQLSEAIATDDQGTRSQEEEGQKSSRRRTVIHVRTAASKRRPTIGQRKSSQSSSSNVHNVASSPTSGTKVASPYKPTASGSSSDRLPEDTQPRLTRATRSGSSQSKQLQGPAEDDSSSEESEDEAKGKEIQRPTDELVDRDFRSKFASRSQINRQQFTSLPGVVHKSSTATETSAPHQAPSAVRTGLPKAYSGKGKRSVEFTDEIIPLKPPGASGPNKVDEHARTPPILPRTKSQLTLLLEKDKREKEEGGNESTSAPR